MSDISTIDTSLYEYYYLVDTQEDFKLYTRTPNGDIEFTDYTKFLSGEKTIIAFPKSIKSPVHNHNYFLKTINDEYVINSIDYEDYNSIVKQEDFYNKSYFNFLNFITAEAHRQRTDALILANSKRCDTSYFSFIPYQIYDGVKTTTSDPSVINQQTIERLISIFCVTGTSALTLTTVPGMGTSFRDWPAVTRCAKTLMGAMKQVIEWASLLDEPFNSSDELPRDAKNWINSLKIPQAVLDEISTTQEDMPLYRYLKGIPNARHGFIEQEELSPLFADWFYRQMMFRTLNSMALNHPDTPNFPEEVLNLEKAKIEAIIYGACILYGVDYETATPDQIISALPHESEIFQVETLKTVKDAINNRNAYL